MLSTSLANACLSKDSANSIGCATLPGFSGLDTRLRGLGSGSGSDSDSSYSIGFFCFALGFGLVVAGAGFGFALFFAPAGLPLPFFGISLIS